MTHKVNVKPLSVNQAWQGRRFKTPAYNSYQKEVLFKLPKIILPKAPYDVYIEFGLSSKLSDIDNGLKPFIDCLVKKYKFDDRDIYFLTVKKSIIPKEKEFIKFSINHLEYDL